MIAWAQLGRRLGVAGAGLTALTAGVGAALWHQLMRRPLPATRGTLRLAGPQASIEISRDRWGVPHVRARTAHDLWFGQGFCHGQDRLWQLELYRRASSGTLAAIAGRRSLPSDRFVRTLGLRRAAEREAVDLDPELRPHLEAFCAGVNAAAAAAPALPIEFQLLRLDFDPWTPADELTVAKLLSLGLSTNWERELLRADMVRQLGSEVAARLDPAYPPENPVASRPADAWSGDGLGMSEQVARLRDSLGLASDATGSNNWAIAPKRSATGGPLLAGDPHLPPSMPGVTYQVGLHLGDRFCWGASLPGRIGIAFGQNNDVAWSFTNAMADVMDLYVERIEGDSYEYCGQSRPLELIEEEIPVRGAAPETLVVRRTHRGPIVNEALGADTDEPLSLRWTTLELPAVTVASVRVLDFAGGPDLVEQLRVHNGPVSNLVWADRHGSIGYRTVGRIPARRGGCPDLPKPGWTDEFEWDGWVPYDELPETVDPEVGFVVSANNRIEPDGYAHHITSDYLDGYRARRIEQLIEAEPAHDLDAFAAMQTDMLSIPGLETARRLARMRPEAEDGPPPIPMDQREVAAIESLRSWDGRMSPDSVPATIYQAFTLRLGREFAREAIGDRDLAERWMDRADNGLLTHMTSPWRWQSHLLALWAEGSEEMIGRSWEELVLDALRGALDDLEARFGRDQAAWRWGAVHRLEFRHALGQGIPVLAPVLNRSLEVGGAQETVAQVGWDPNRPFEAIWAPCWRILADPLAPERSRWAQFAGQSGHPASPHYDDAQAPWLEGRTQPMAGEGPWQTLSLEPA